MKPYLHVLEGCFPLQQLPPQPAHLPRVPLLSGLSLLRANEPIICRVTPH
jgi:hypothetical protein